MAIRKVLFGASNFAGMPSSVRACHPLAPFAGLPPSLPVKFHKFAGFTKGGWEIAGIRAILAWFTRAASYGTGGPPSPRRSDGRHRPNQPSPTCNEEKGTTGLFGRHPVRLAGRQTALQQTQHKTAREKSEAGEKTPYADGMPLLRREEAPHK